MTGVVGNAATSTKPVVNTPTSEPAVPSADSEPTTRPVAASEASWSLIVSGVTALSREPYPFSGLWTRLHGILRAFGPERLMWGSDYSRVMGRNIHPRNPEGRSNYGEIVAFLRDTNEVGEADKAMMFSGAIRTWFGWPK